MAPATPKAPDVAGNIRSAGTPAVGAGPRTDGAKATGEKAAQYGDQAKSAVSSQPDKTVDKAKAKVHKAKAHHHAAVAKDAAQEIPK